VLFAHILPSYDQNGGDEVTLTIGSVSPTPEPASLGLLGLGGLAMMRRRRTRIKGASRNARSPERL
jgi:MYXO-CTERM domain-containing protein